VRLALGQSAGTGNPGRLTVEHDRRRQRTAPFDLNLNGRLGRPRTGIVGAWEYSSGLIIEKAHHLPPLG